MPPRPRSSPPKPRSISPSHVPARSWIVYSPLPPAGDTSYVNIRGKQLLPGGGPDARPDFFSKSRSADPRNPRLTRSRSAGSSPSSSRITTGSGTWPRAVLSGQEELQFASTSERAPRPSAATAKPFQFLQRLPDLFWDESHRPQNSDRGMLMSRRADLAGHDHRLEKSSSSVRTKPELKQKLGRDSVRRSRSR